MRVEKKPKAFAYRVPIGDYNYLQCSLWIAIGVPTNFKIVPPGLGHSIEISRQANER